MLTAIRCRDAVKAWIETYRSLDDGAHWTRENVPAPDLGEGNPPSMIRLKDGRVCLTYGYRARPYGMRARLSDDGGRTWADEIILRDDGGGRDLGYPRTVQRPDGKIVTIYYFHDQPKGDRYIAATIWSPRRIGSIERIKRCPGSGPLPVSRVSATHPNPSWRPKPSRPWPPFPPTLHRTFPRAAP